MIKDMVLLPYRLASQQLVKLDSSFCSDADQRSLSAVGLCRTDMKIHREE
jgi:hypothetical protein